MPDAEVEIKINQLTAQLESETFKKIYSEDLLKKEQDRGMIQESLIKQQKNTIDQLTKQLETDEEKGNSDSQELKINELRKANQQLKTQLTATQQSVGEVMFIAKQQAQEILAEAENKATITIDQAKQELLDVGFKASQLAKEVKESQHQVNDVYRELTEHLATLETKGLSFDYTTKNSGDF